MTWLVPLALGILIWTRRKQSPWLLAAGSLSVAVVLPVLGLLPFSFQYFSTVADRYLYLALLGPALAVACFLERLPSPRVAVHAEWRWCVSVRWRACKRDTGTIPSR